MKGNSEDENNKKKVRRGKGEADRETRNSEKPKDKEVKKTQEKM